MASFSTSKPRGQRAAEVCRSPLGGLFSHRRAHPCRDKNRAYKADSVRAHAGDFRGRSAYERLRCRQARYRAIRCWLAIPPVHKSALLPAASARKGHCEPIGKLGVFAVNADFQCMVVNDLYPLKGFCHQIKNVSSEAPASRMARHLASSRFLKSGNPQCVNSSCRKSGSPPEDLQYGECRWRSLQP